MQQCTSLPLDFFPRDSFYLAGLYVVQAAHDFLLPGGINVLVQLLRPNWRSNYQPVPPVHSQARPGLFAAIRGLLGSYPKLYAPLQLG
jgi:hypothetical protein